MVIVPIDSATPASTHIGILTTIAVSMVSLRPGPDDRG